MTKEEILAMSPSVEMGNLVAIEVMKWHRDGDHWVTPEGFWVKAEGLDGWYPWRDISAAWQVVKKMREMEDSHGNHLLCCLDIYSDHDFVWEIRWSYSELSLYNDGHKKHRSGCYDDLPEAICKAALLAKLIMEGGK